MIKLFFPHFRKSIFRIFLLAISLFFVPFFSMAQFSDGDGSVDSPYIITTPEQLIQLATFVNNGNSNYNNKFYKLGNDIDLEDQEWTPIGHNEIENFKGNFDGNNQKIFGLEMNNSMMISCGGLFGYVNAATIKNLGLEGININIQSPTLLSVTTYAGGLVAYSSGNTIITNCYTSGTVSSVTSGTNDSYAGGIVGRLYNNGTITNCYTTVQVTTSCASNRYGYAGGIVGHISGTPSNISNSYATGKVTGVRVGGIAGYLMSATISNCAALNPQLVRAIGTSTNFGRIVGFRSGGTLADNIAFNAMINYNNSTTWSEVGATTINGEDITPEQVNADGTLGERFISANGWTTANKKLPGLFGETVIMPEHLLVPTSPTITTQNLPNGEVGTPYTEILDADGDDPITWTVENGSLPDDLTLSPEGVISGTPTTANTFTFTVKATNNVGSDTKELEITIINPAVPPTIITQNLPNGEVGTPYTETLDADGDDPITWTVENGSLPDDLTLSPEGVISGTPTTANTFTFTVKATNNVGSDTKELTITIINPAVPPTITTQNLPNGEVGTPYTETLDADGDDPITWTLENGSLPNGLTLSLEGVISGTPTTANTFTFTVKATNNVGSDTKELVITIVNPAVPPTISTQNLPNGEVGTPYTETLDADGDDPITWTLENGSLPNGLTLSPEGVISGTPTTANTFTFTVKATNNVGSDIKELTITIGNIGISDYSIQILKTYPNPVCDVLKIVRTTDDKASIEIYNSMGVLIMKPFEINEMEVDINVLMFTSGVYFIRIKDATVRFIKK